MFKETVRLNLALRMIYTFTTLFFEVSPFPLYFTGSGLNDGQWHAMRLVTKENFAMLTIDGDEASAVRSTSPLTITTGGTYHLGGKVTPTSDDNTLLTFFSIHCQHITLLASAHQGG